MADDMITVEGLLSLLEGVPITIVTNPLGALETRWTVRHEVTGVFQHGPTLLTTLHGFIKRRVRAGLGEPQ